MNDPLMIVIGMMLVTYIPRAIPFFILSDKRLPKALNQFLEYVPYAALGALIIPGALTAVPNAPIVCLIGLSVAVIVSLFKANVIVSVVGSIGIVYLLLLL